MMSLCAGVSAVFAAMLIVVNPSPKETLDIATVELLPQHKVEAIAEASARNTLSDEDYEYFAKCVMSEAGDQDYEGICYVVDVILNRSEQWNMSIRDVINHRTWKKNHWEYQFEVVLNGRIHKAKPSKEVYKAINEEMKHRKREDILYFCMGGYFSWAENCFHHGDHFFSKERSQK